ncbi:MAG: hypothetical protein ACR2RL_00790 [Gammaproteobacteria bacterium]
MRKQKRSRRKLDPNSRQKNARKWLLKERPKVLLSKYAERYGVPESVAFLELLQLGYGDEVQIEEYERSGIAWEYKVDGYSGEMKVVPLGTPDWDLHLY